MTQEDPRLLSLPERPAVRQQRQQAGVPAAPQQQSEVATAHREQLQLPPNQNDGGSKSTRLYTEAASSIGEIVGDFALGMWGQRRIPEPNADEKEGGMQQLDAIAQMDNPLCPGEVLKLLPDDRSHQSAKQPEIPCIDLMSRTIPSSWPSMLERYHAEVQAEKEQAERVEAARRQLMQRRVHLDTRMSRLEHPEETRWEEKASKMPVFGDPLCISVIFHDYRRSDKECTDSRCADQGTHVRMSQTCERHGSLIPDLFDCLISDKAWMSRMLQSGHRFVLLGPADKVLDITKAEVAGRSHSFEALRQRMLCNTRLTLLCMDAEDRCVPLDQHALDANTVMGISGCLRPWGVSTGSVKTNRKTMAEHVSGNVKPVYRGLKMELDFGEMLKGEGPYQKRGMVLSSDHKWNIALSLPLTFESLREPLWMDSSNFFPWLRWDSLAQNGEVKQQVDVWDSWDRRGIHENKTAYLTLDRESSSVGIATAQGEWDWAGTEGDCMVVSTTVTKPNSSLVPSGARSSRNLFFHLQGVPMR